MKGEICCVVAIMMAFILPKRARSGLLPEKGQFHIVVLAGQSNMAGRGIPTDADRKPHPRVLKMDWQGEWVPCVEPVHFDLRSAGVGPGKSFGEALAESDHSIVVGLVPCAVGDTSLVDWSPGSAVKRGNDVWRPYDDCVQRVRAAKRVGVLKAILWHQGENDCWRNEGALYQSRFLRLVRRLRTDIGAEGIPLIVGQLSQYQGSILGNGTVRLTAFANTGQGKLVSDAQRAVCERLSGPGRFVESSPDYTLNADLVHLSRDSQVEFGKRYFSAYAELCGREEECGLRTGCDGQ